MKSIPLLFGGVFLRKGFFSLVLVLIFAASLFVLINSIRESERMAAKTTLEVLRVEKDYYLRSSLREALKAALFENDIAAAQELEDYAKEYYLTQEVEIEFWCAQSGEVDLQEAKKWKLTDSTLGFCFNTLNPEESHPDSTNACSLMLARDAVGGGVSVVHAASTKINEEGEFCAYPELNSTKPSVFGISIRYEDGNESIAVIPEGVVVSYG